jgi:hypothetical protein
LQIIHNHNTNCDKYASFALSVCRINKTDNISQSKTINLHESRLSTTSIRKIFCCSLFFTTPVLFTIQVFWGYNSIVSVGVFTGSLALMGLARNIRKLCGRSYSILRNCLRWYSSTTCQFIWLRHNKNCCAHHQRGTKFSTVDLRILDFGRGQSIRFFILSHLYEQSWSLKKDNAEMEKLQNYGSKETP